jgi:nucleoside-triphosphatase THEP1
VKHLFLTGAIQTGKTTAVERFLAQSGLAADGVLTRFDSRGESRTLFIHRFGGAPDEKQAVARMSPELFEVYPEVFDGFGAELLRGCGRRELIILDELGVMEERAPAFKAEVFRLLGGTVPVLGVLKLADCPFLDAVRGSENVRMITVTLENRDAVPELIAAHFAEKA